MLDKILSKKIKSPLSLRGKERRSNLSGFSLIELMIAITILAVAIFGIFQAYSVCFLGMADARDRTVATNYLREAVEDFKNMDFNQVKSKPTTLIPDTKFSRGTYVLNLEMIDDVVTLKKVITQVRWIDRKGNVKTEKVSTIIYNKPATSEVGDEATKLVLYAQSYYTILPEHEVILIAEIHDEKGNIFDWDGPITFSVITNPVNDPIVGSITTSQPVNAVNGTASCIFTAVSGDAIEGTERIQASAIVDGNDLSDTVNIRVTTGPVGIILEPATEEDRILSAGIGIISNIDLKVVKADYETLIEYNSPITLSAIGPGTLSTNTITSLPTEGTSFTLTSNGTPGVVEITASAPDLDIGYTEITFTGEPDSILVTPEKKSIYPGEDITVTVTIMDENNVSVEYDGVVNLSVDPDYGSFNPNSLDFGSTSLLELESTFTADIDATEGETISIQANAGDLSGSTNITILSLLTPKYLDIFAYPFSVDLFEGETSTTVTAKVYDISGKEIVTTYNTNITFYAKVVVEGVEVDFGGTFSNNNITPTDGEAEVLLLSLSEAGTVNITASSGDLVLRPEGGVEVIFYQSADHIELSADPSSIEADGRDTSIITATVCDADGNRVANYGQDGDKSITFTTNIGGFPENSDLATITSEFFDEGQVSVEVSSTDSETDATITALSSDELTGSVSIELTGDIPTVLTLGDITNWNDFLISFDITVSGSPLYLKEIYIEWDNKQAVLDEIIIESPFPGDATPLPIDANGSDSPFIESAITKTLVKNENGEVSNISLNFSIAKMKDNIITVNFTDEDDVLYVVSFQVPK